MKSDREQTRESESLDVAAERQQSLIETLGPDLKEALNLSPEADAGEVREAIFKCARQDRALELGLLGNSEPMQRLVEQLGNRLTDELGLDPTASSIDIRNAINDLERRTRAAEIGLPATATRDEVKAHAEELCRMEVAKELGLPEDATWEDIHERSGELRQQARAAELGLPSDASRSEIRQREAQIKEREKAGAKEKEKLRQGLDPSLPLSPEEWKRRHMLAGNK